VNTPSGTISVIGALNVKIPSKRFAALAIVAAVALAACGGDDDASDTTVGEAGSATTEAMEEGTATTEATDDTATTEAMDDTATTMEGGAETDLSGLSGSIFVSGSSTVEPISIAAGDAFADMAPGVAVTIEGPGTGDGFAKFCAGETDVSDASRAISDEEIAECEASGIEFI